MVHEELLGAAALAETPEFWTEAPYMSRDAAEWLLERAPRAVAFDFPQDYTIRLLLQGRGPAA